jgi:MoaA/NifB/PqqE/SkfB family radical SAM enzyme
VIVVWRVTERCNLACAFCAYDRRLPIARRDADAGLVSRFAKVLAAYQLATRDPVLVSWIGGEPLLWGPVFESSTLLAGSYGMHVSATTNGTTLHSPEVRRQLLATFRELTISVDGFEDFHNDMRGWRNGWQRLKAAIVALRDERAASGAALKLRANIVLMRDNLAIFDALCEELADWGVNEITFNQLGGRDRPEFFPTHRLRGEDAKVFSARMPALQARLVRRGVRLCANSHYLQRIEASAENRSIFVPDCGPGQRFLFIDEQSRVSPCNFTSDALGIPIADVTSVEDVLALPARFNAARATRSMLPCRDCPSTQVFAKFES